MPITMVITAAGLDALVAANEGMTAAIQITQVGLADEAFDPAPTLDALPHEFKRLDSVHGLPISPTMIHMTAIDQSADTYDLYGIGLFLSDGTLFASYSQETPIFRKVSVASFLLAEDIAFSGEHEGDIIFGDANFTYPPASETVQGIAELATDAEVLAGEDGTRIVTPAALAAAYVALASLGIADGVATLGGDGKLAVAQRPPVDLIDVFPVASEAAMLACAAGVGDFAVRTDSDQVFVLGAVPAATLGNWVELSLPAPVTSVNGQAGNVVLDAADVGAPPSARAITGGGLATGGGSLAADRVITVAIASDAEALAGADNTKAVTPLALAGILAAIAGKVGTARAITGGGLATGGGSLAADRLITVAIASAAEALAGANNAKACTPASLADILTLIGTKAAASRNITGSGLAGGGGNLNADRVITVTAASAAETAAMAIATKAVTPAGLATLVANLTASIAGVAEVISTSTTLVIKLGGVPVIQVTRATVSANASAVITYPLTFPTRCVAAFADGGSTAQDEDNTPFVTSPGPSSCAVYNAQNTSVTAYLVAFGN